MSRSCWPCDTLEGCPPDQQLGRPGRVTCDAGAHVRARWRTGPHRRRRRRRRRRLRHPVPARPAHGLPDVAADRALRPCGAPARRSSVPAPFSILARSASQPQLIRAIAPRRPPSAALERGLRGERERRPRRATAPSAIRSTFSSSRPSPAPRASLPASHRQARRGATPLDAERAGVRREAGDAEQEADDEVRAGRAPDVQPDAAHESRHPQRPEDDADGAAERADPEPAGDGGRQPQALPRARLHRPQREIDPAPDEHGRDRRVERPLGDVVGEQRADDRAGDRAAAPSRRRPASRPGPRGRGATAPAPAAAAEMAMFVPAAASGLPARRRSAAAAASRARAPASSPRSPRRTSRGTLARAPRLPQRLVAAGGRVRRAREDEEQVGEPVQVDERRAGSARPPASPSERLALGAAADRARDVQAAPRPRCRRAARSSAAPAASALNASQSCSSRSIISCSTRSRSVDAPGHREVGADVEELVLDPRRAARAARSGTSPASTTPSAELSSSTVPNAPIRQSSFETREPSPSEVSPASPPRV